MNAQVVLAFIVNRGEHLHRSTVGTLDVMVTDRLIGAYREYLHIPSTKMIKGIISVHEKIRNSSIKRW